jgi:hypothetical protein
MLEHPVRSLFTGFSKVARYTLSASRRVPSTSSNRILNNFTKMAYSLFVKKWRRENKKNSMKSIIDKATAMK